MKFTSVDRIGGRIGALRAQIPTHVLHRHVNILLRYSTSTKLVNAASALVSYFRERTILTSRPLFLKVELSRRCTVGCLYCRVPKAEQFYPEEEFRRLVDELADHLFMVQLYEVGEPLLYDPILNSIRYVHERGVATVISTSLSVEKPDVFWKDLVNSGLDRLIAAIDGLTEPTYRKYRTNGDFPLVMDNLKSIIRYRSESRSRMRIEWQMIALPWNQLEQFAARKHAISIGCDSFRLIPEANLVRLGFAERREKRESNCLWSYTLFLVNAYGIVVPCFKPDCYPEPVGDMHSQTFEEIWNGWGMQQLRRRDLIQRQRSCGICRE